MLVEGVLTLVRKDIVVSLRTSTGSFPTDEHLTDRIFDQQAAQGTSSFLPIPSSIAKSVNGYTASMAKG